MTRREFVGGIGATGAMVGFNAWAAAPALRPERPKLRVGIVSDLHIQTDAATGEIVGWSNDKTFVHALEYFRDQEVDAVVIPGDFTDYGKLSEMKVAADDWFRVFPNDRLPNGRKVERIFVFGNHEWDYFCRDPKWARERYGAGDEAGILKLVLHGDPKGHWERFWHEPFEHYYTKEVKGYRFFAAHWMSDGPTFNCFNGARDFLAKHQTLIDPKLPFFYVQHAPPTGTVCPWTQVHDYGALGPALKAYPNAVALTGHTHLSITDEENIWQGEYTVVGAGCMRWTDASNYLRKPFGYENSRSPTDMAKHDPVKMMKLGWADWSARQGMMMDVFDDRMVFHRRDFAHDLALGEDWVVPLDTKERPYAPARRRAEIPAPQFADGAVLAVSRGLAKTRGVDPNIDGPDRVAKDSLLLTIPQALAVPQARVRDYEVELRTADKTERLCFVLDAGYAHALSLREKQQPSVCPIPVEKLPSGVDLRFAVTPIGHFGKRGRPLVSAVQRI